MKIHGSMTILGRHYYKDDDIPWYKAYPFFLIHMLVFGGASFLMAYSEINPDVTTLYGWGIFSFLTYIPFYFAMFGRDEVKWMLINAALGFVGIYTQLGWILSFFGREYSDYPIHIHIIPSVFIVLYTFLLRNAVLDITRSREDVVKKRDVEYSYISVLVLVYLSSYYFNL